MSFIVCNCYGDTGEGGCRHMVGIRYEQEEKVSHSGGAPEGRTGVQKSGVKGAGGSGSLVFR